jgi:serine phosphatase RsbU (regulator of sigma subunit)
MDYGFSSGKVRGGRILGQRRFSSDSARRFFLSSDGIIDQIGETRRRGFGKKRLIAAIAENADGDVSNQVRAVGDALNAHQGAQRRRDDIAMIGVQPL